LIVNQSDAVYLNSPNKEGDMDMDRRTWIGIAIAAVILVILVTGYVMYSRTGTVEPANPSSTTTQPIAPAPKP
jgi:hypothetical protein